MVGAGNVGAEVVCNCSRFATTPTSSSSSRTSRKDCPGEALDIDRDRGTAVLGFEPNVERLELLKETAASYDVVVTAEDCPGRLE